MLYKSLVFTCHKYNLLLCTMNKPIQISTETGLYKFHFITINSLRLSGNYICVSKLTIIGSDNGLSPGRRQAIIWTNAGILLIQSIGKNFNEILSEIHTFSYKKMHMKMSSAKWWSFCLRLNVLNMLYSRKVRRSATHWFLWFDTFSFSRN